MPNNYIVTGCAGFIGARVTEMLIEAGHRVTGIDDLSDGYDPRLKEWRLERLNAEERFTFRKADIRDFGAMRGVFVSDRFDALLNLAARAGVRQSVEDPWIYAQTNYLAMVNLLELCRGNRIGKVVQASTSSVYGDDTPAPFSESAPASRPLSPYAASKKAAEDLCYTYHYLHGLDVTVFRFFTVYGPAGRPDMSIFKFIRAVAEREPLTLFGDGGTRDFTHVDDVARGVIAGPAPARPRGRQPRRRPARQRQESHRVDRVATGRQSRGRSARQARRRRGLHVRGRIQGRAPARLAPANRPGGRHRKRSGLVHEKPHPRQNPTKLTAPIAYTAPHPS